MKKKTLEKRNCRTRTKCVIAVSDGGDDDDILRKQKLWKKE